MKRGSSWDSFGVSGISYPVNEKTRLRGLVRVLQGANSLKSDGNWIFSGNQSSNQYGQFSL